MNAAARAGFPAPQTLLDCTPREAQWALQSFAAQRRRELELADALGWLAGQYAAIGLNAPGRYPRKPCGVGAFQESMNDEQMKSAFLRMAQRGGTA